MHYIMSVERVPFSVLKHLEPVIFIIIILVQITIDTRPYIHIYTYIPRGEVIRWPNYNYVYYYILAYTQYIHFHFSFAGTEWVDRISGIKVNIPIKRNTTKKSEEVRSNKHTYMWLLFPNYPP